jgi:hypothetical protein
MEFRKEREILLNQTNLRDGKPPDHARRSTTFDNYSTQSCDRFSWVLSDATAAL